MHSSQAPTVILKASPAEVSNLPHPPQSQTEPRPHLAQPTWRMWKAQKGARRGQGEGRFPGNSGLTFLLS